MEKAKKVALTKFEFEKLAHKICAKNAQNRAKNCKNDKNCTKKGKTHLKKCLKNQALAHL